MFSYVWSCFTSSIHKKTWRQDPSILPVRVKFQGTDLCLQYCYTPRNGILKSVMMSEVETNQSGSLVTYADTKLSVLQPQELSQSQVQPLSQLVMV